MLRVITFALALLALLLGAWLAGRAVEARRPRLGAWVWIALTVAAPFGAIPLASLALGAVSCGRRQCDLCARVEHVEALFGVPVLTFASEVPQGAGELAAYAQWMEPFAGAEHAHAWWPIGGWLQGVGTVRCTMRQPVEAWHACLPRVADRALAERATRAFLALAPHERRDWMRGATIEVGAVEGRDEVEHLARFEAWLRETLEGR